MISCSSTFASSAPATSAKVIFGVSPVSSFAFDLPNENARLPPACIWRKRKIQSAMMMSDGTKFTRNDVKPPRDSLASIVTPAVSSLVSNSWLSAKGSCTMKPLAGRESWSTGVRKSPSRRLPS